MHFVEEYLQLREWLVQNPDWIVILIFSLAALEAVAVIGSIVPGVALMFGLSIMAGTVDLDVRTVLIAGTLGAMAGDGISYALGHHFKHRIDNVWPFRTHPQWLQASEAFVERHGGKSLIFGRFIGPLRAFVPMAAGIFQMPFKRFIWFNLLSALAWAPVHILPGYAIGSAVTNPNMPGRDQLLFFGELLVLVAVLTWALPWLSQVTRGWRHRHAPPNSGRYFAADGRPESQWLAAWLAVIGLLGFAVVAVCLPLLGNFDQHIAREMANLRQPALDHVFIAFSLMGEKPALYMAGGIIMTWLSLRREWRTLLYAVLAGAVCLLLPALLKPLFAIPRPTLLLMPPESYSFPSGHALCAVVVWGFLYVVLARQLNQEAKPWLLAMVLSIIVFTSASRPYLGVHWVTDIAGGLLLGLFILALLRLGWYRGPGLRVSAWESSAVVISAVTISIYLIVLPVWPVAWLQYEPKHPVKHVVPHPPVPPKHKPKHHRFFP